MHLVRSSYGKVAVVSIAVLVLAAEGYFGYLWYQRYHAESVDAGPVVSAAPGGTEATAPDEPEPEDDRGDSLVHRATPENIVENSTYIDHPMCNGNPDAVLLVTQAWDPNGAAANPHPIGVWYDENRDGRWAIFNQDLASMPENAVFNVAISEEPGRNVFVHRASPANISGESTYIDNPSANASPEALLSITPVWNPSGANGTYLNHPVGVRYDATEERWAIRNEDLATMPNNAAFGVSVVRRSTS